MRVQLSLESLVSIACGVLVDLLHVLHENGSGTCWEKLMRSWRRRRRRAMEGERETVGGGVEDMIAGDGIRLEDGACEDNLIPFPPGTRPLQED
jgi:hypothetical protein